MSVLTTGMAMIAFAAEEDAQFDPATVSPGVVGFAVSALFALAVIFLGFDLVRRLRRSKFRYEISESLAAEVAERDAGVSPQKGATPGHATGVQSDTENPNLEPRA
ncbi:hypothetical protein [Leucobacter sp. W1478]|uniref:hypothetical protein n=1 Tax=Leucobacter sp. W1478 TaxID=3439065 RepID=UPI003F3298AC